MELRLRNGFASLGLPLLIHAGIATAADGGGLVIARSGDLPILLTVPHGGLAKVPDVPQRTRGTMSTDGHTIELAQAVAKHLRSSLGGEPYLVAARFSRKFIDANRGEFDAFESPRAKPVYDAYHGQIRRFVAEMRKRFPRGALLLDVHGQSDEPGVVHRGTQNGATVAALTGRHGPEALAGPKGVLGMVESRGYRTFPPLGGPAEDRRYNGGYTVHTYGSHTPQGVDAIQIEIGRDLRKDPAFIAALSEGIAVFYRTYLEDPAAQRSVRVR